MTTHFIPIWSLLACSLNRARIIYWLYVRTMAPFFSFLSSNLVPSRRRCPWTLITFSSSFCSFPSFFLSFFGLFHAHFLLSSSWNEISHSEERIETQTDWLETIGKIRIFNDSKMFLFKSILFYPRRYDERSKWLEKNENVRKCCVYMLGLPRYVCCFIFCLAACK